MTAIGENKKAAPGPPFSLLLDRCFAECLPAVGFNQLRLVLLHRQQPHYFIRYVMRPLDKSYGVISTFTLSPVRMRM